jgi:hypothetical protein
VTATSDTPSLYPPGGINVTETGGSRQLVLTPANNLSGQARITLTVEDAGGLRTTNTFLATVRPVNDRPTLNPLNDLEVESSAGATVVNLAGISSGASNEAQFLTVVATSSDPDIVPNPTVSYASPAAIGSLTFTPMGVGGTATISVTVQDDSFDDGSGSNRVTQTFTVQVSGPAAGPALSIALVNDRVVVSWSTNAGSGFILHSSLGVDGGTWSAVESTPVVVNGRYTVNNQATGAVRIYRLCSGCGGPPVLTIRRNGTDVVLGRVGEFCAGGVLGVPVLGRIDNQRGSQIRCVRRLIPVQPELREVVVHVGRGSWFGLLAFALSGLLDDDFEFLRCVELLRHVVGTLQLCIRGVGPEPLDIRLAVGRPWRGVGLRRRLRRRLRCRSGLRRARWCLSRDRDGQPHERDRNRQHTDSNERSLRHLKSPSLAGLLAQMSIQ